MKTIQFLTLLIITGLLVSCQKDSSAPSQTQTTTPIVPSPSANYTYTNAGVAPDTVVFTNSSTNATSYNWDFGDNGTSNEVSPTHVFSNGGTYTVKLVATGNGGTNSITKTVSVRTPTGFKILSVKITAIPLNKSNGTSWDVSPNTGPDVTFAIEKVPLNVQYDHPFYIQDVASNSLPLNFVLQNSFGQPAPVILPIDNNLFALNVYDYDPPSSIEKIAALTFVPKNYITGTGSNPYPGIITLSYGGVTAELTVQYL